MKNVVVNAVIVGGHVNAQTIVKNLKEIRYSGRIILLRTPQESRGLAAFCNPDVEVWRVGLQEPEDLLRALRERFGKAQEKTAVFFTDERFHPVFADLDANVRQWLTVRVGSKRHVHTILDRFLFCQHLSALCIADVPQTISGTADPFQTFGNAFVVRPRYSWYGVAHREHVFISRSRAEYDRIVSGFFDRGLEAEDLCYQELLSIRDEDNVSICGWYDKDRQYLFCTRKVLQHPPKTGNGDVVERIEPPEGVMEAALRVLQALEYEGPFELEFVFDERSIRYQVIELNPRFWMQHGLLEAVTGYALVSSYLNRAPLTPASRASETRYWVNPLYAFFRLMKADFRAVRYALSKDSCLPFSAWQAICFAPVHMFNKVLRRC